MSRTTRAWLIVSMAELIYPKQELLELGTGALSSRSASCLCRLSSVDSVPFPPSVPPSLTPPALLQPMHLHTYTDRSSWLNANPGGENMALLVLQGFVLKVVLGNCWSVLDWGDTRWESLCRALCVRWVKLSFICLGTFENLTAVHLTITRFRWWVLHVCSVRFFQVL